MAASWPRDPGGQPLSHVRIIGTAATFGSKPRNVVVGVLDVAGLTVHAVLRIDHKPEIAPLAHPLIDAGRTIAIRGSGIDVVLGTFLQGHLSDLEMNRLVFLVVGV